MCQRQELFFLFFKRNFRVGSRILMRKGRDTLSEYSGKLTISQVTKSPNSLANYALDTVKITKDNWEHDTTNDIYTFTINQNKKSSVVSIFNTDTKKEVLADVCYINDNTIKILSIHNDNITVTIARNETPTVSSDSDIFHPETDSNSVKFADGETLETKYLNGDLSKFMSTNPNTVRYVKEVEDDTFIEDKGKYDIVINGSEHQLGLNVVVSVIMKRNPDTGIFTQATDGVISINNNKAYNEGTTVIITFDQKFTGFIVLQKEKFTK